MMTARYIARMLLLVLVFASLWLSTSDAYAEGAKSQGTPANGELMAMGNKGSEVKCRSYPEAQGGVLLGLIVPCLTRTVETSTMQFSQQLIDMLNPILYSFITLVVVLFGVKIFGMGTQPGGERQLKKEGFALLLKAAFVVGMLQMVPNFWVPAAYDIMSESQGIVANAIGNGTSMHCEVASYGDGNTPMIWKQMDCVLGKLYGITKGEGGKPSMLLMASGVGFVSGFLFGGSFGIAVFVMLVGVLWTLVRIVIRTASAFMTGYLYVCIMLILSPIFMPLILLKPTEQYFQKWWSNIIGGMLVPVIITAYAMVALMLYDAILFAPNSEITKLFDKEFAAKVQQAPPLQPFDCTHFGNPKARADASGKSEKDIYSSKLMQQLLPGMSGGNNPCSALKVPQIYMGKEEFRKMFDSLVKLLITSLLIAQGFKTVQGMAMKLSGSISASRIASGGGMEGSMDSKLADVRGAAENVVRDKSGADFVASLGKLPEGVTKGFLGGIRK